MSELFPVRLFALRRRCFPHDLIQRCQVAGRSRLVILNLGVVVGDAVVSLPFFRNGVSIDFVVEFIGYVELYRIVNPRLQ